MFVSLECGPTEGSPCAQYVPRTARFLVLIGRSSWSPIFCKLLRRVFHD